VHGSQYLQDAVTASERDREGDLMRLCEDGFDTSVGYLVSVESEDREVVETEVGVNRVTGGVGFGSLRRFEGTTVCVEVVEIEDVDEDEDVAGEGDLRSSEDGEGTLRVWREDTASVREDCNDPLKHSRDECDSSPSNSRNSRA